MRRVGAREQLGHEVDQPAAGGPGAAVSAPGRAAMVCFALALAATSFVFAIRGFEGSSEVSHPIGVAPMAPSKIAFTMGDPGRVYLAHPNGTNVQRLTTGDEEASFAKSYGYANDSDITWSPDGSTIAFMCWYDGPAGSITSLCSVGIGGNGFH